MLHFLNRNFSENLFHLRFLFYFPFPLCGFEYLQKMSKFYQRQRLNPLSILFHHFLIRILIILHLYKTRDSWESFLLRNNFTLPNNITELPLHLNENPSPYRSNPTIENLCVDPQEDHATTDQTYVVIRNPLDKKPRCDFVPIKSLEEVLDVLKDRFPVVPIHEPTHVVLNKSFVKKKGR